MVTSSTNSDEFVNDTAYSTFIRDPEYFNLEVSECETSLVINASKKGIDAFIKLYGSLPSHSKIISFKDLQRVPRRPVPYTILENKQVLPTDPTPYSAEWTNGGINSVINVLHIQFLQDSDEEVVFCIGLSDGIPALTVNEKGWHKFLDILRCLRDHSYWFYVTIPNLPFWKHLPFQLTTPYRGDAQDHVFKALACIRLEPEEHICINTTLELISGNCAGLLFFAQWLHRFAFSQESSKDIFNIWNNPLKNDNSRDSPRKGGPPSWVRLRKTQEESPYAIFTFAQKDGGDDVYIFGNPKGLQELSEVVEEWAFETDHDSYCERRNPVRYIRGYSAGGVPMPEGFRSIPGWQVLGGAFYSPSYNPVGFKEGGMHPVDIYKTFVNKRTILNDPLS